MYYLNNFHDEDSLKESIIKYIDFYNNFRPQERFEDLAPIEVRTNALNDPGNERDYPIAENNRIIKFDQQHEVKQISVTI